VGHLQMRSSSPSREEGVNTEQSCTGHRLNRHRLPPLLEPPPAALLWWSRRLLPSSGGATACRPLLEPSSAAASVGAAARRRLCWSRLSLLESHVRSPLLCYLYHNPTGQNPKLLAHTCQVKRPNFHLLVRPFSKIGRQITISC
jgi:hypothetical protein